jgi:hypothetical protein
VSLLLARPAPDPELVARRVFTCQTVGCHVKPTKPCVYSSGKSKGQVRKEGAHAPRLLAATEYIAAVDAGTA